MFRKNDPVEPTPPAPRTGGEPPPHAPPPLPELPRRRVDLPTAPSESAHAAPPPRAGGAAANPAPAPAREGATAGDADAEAGKRLIVGRGIRLRGEISSCDRLVVHGEVEVILNETRRLEITTTGRFAGAFEGDLAVRGRLLVRSGGRIEGKIRFGELEVERGGRIAGSVNLFGAAATAASGRAGNAKAGGAPAAAPPPVGPRPVLATGGGGDGGAAAPEPRPAPDQAGGVDEEGEGVRPVGRAAAG